MRRSIVGPVVPGQDERRGRLGDIDRHAAALVDVVDAAAERPRRRPAWHIGEGLAAKGQDAAAGRQIAYHAGHSVNGGPVRRPIVDARVAGHHDGRISLGDAADDGPDGIVVVPRHVGERPAVAVGPSVGVGRAAQVQADQALTHDARRAARRLAHRSIVDARVAGHRDHSVSLGDRQGAVNECHRVVARQARAVGDTPGDAIAAHVGRGAVAVAAVREAQALAVDAGEEGRPQRGRQIHRAPVNMAAVADRVADRHRVNSRSDGPEGIVIVTRYISEGPSVGIGPGVGVCRAVQIQAGQGLAQHARRRPRRLAHRPVVDARVAGHRDHSVSLGDVRRGRGHRQRVVARIRAVEERARERHGLAEALVRIVEGHRRR